MRMGTIKGGEKGGKVRIGIYDQLSYLVGCLDG